MAKKAYVGVSDVARRVSKAYVGVNGVARKVKKIYVGDSNNVAREVYSSGPKIVTWAGGTDAEIVAMVAAADRGEINLSDYWSVGDTRNVNISAIAASGSNSYGSWSVNSSQPAQTVQFVLVDSEHPFTLVESTASGRTTSSFAFQVKNCLYNGTGIDTPSTVTNWNRPSLAKNWCNSAFRGAIPSTLLPIFKRFITLTANNNTNTLRQSQDYFAFFASKETHGITPNNAYSCEDSLVQMDYFKTSSNLLKTCATQSAASGYWWWWTRTIVKSTQAGYYMGGPNGTLDTPQATSDLAGYAPYGVF